VGRADGKNRLPREELRPESPNSAVAKTQAAPLDLGEIDPEQREVGQCPTDQGGADASRLASVTDTANACGLTNMGVVRINPSLEMMTPEPTRRTGRLTPSLKLVFVHIKCGPPPQAVGKLRFMAASLPGPRRKTPATRRPAGG